MSDANDVLADPSSDRETQDRTYKLTQAIFDVIDAHMASEPGACVPDVLAAISVASGTVLAQLQVDVKGHFYIVGYSAGEAFRAIANGRPNTYPEGWARPKSLESYEPRIEKSDKHAN